jgi:hypothetical protein
VAESFQDKKKMSDEHFRAAALGEPDETTPPVISPAVNEFAAALDGEAPRYVPVINDLNGLYGWCSDGVLEKIHKDGGTIRFGWTIWEWPRIMLTAEFHAVWVSPQEELIDITPKPHGEERIVFVPAPAYAADFDFDQRPRNRRRRLYEAADPTKEIAAHMARMTPGQLAYEEKRAAKAGVTVEEHLRSKRRPDPKVTMIDDYIRASDEYDKEIDAIPGAGYVKPTKKLADLMMEKLRLQTALKSC